MRSVCLLCYIMLCYVMLCYGMLCYVMYCVFTAIQVPAAMKETKTGLQNSYFDLEFHSLLGRSIV